MEQLTLLTFTERKVVPHGALAKCIVFNCWVSLYHPISTSESTHINFDLGALPRLPEPKAKVIINALFHIKSWTLNYVLHKLMSLASL